MVLGTVKAIHIRNDLLNDRGLVDPNKLKPVARLGDISFSSIGPGYRMEQKVWKKDEKELEEAAKKGVHYYYT